MSLTPVVVSGFRHRLCCVAALQQRRGVSKRDVKRQEEAEKELRKSDTRKAHELLGAPFPWPLEPKEDDVFKRFPRFQVPIVPEQENPLYKEKPSYIFNNNVKLYEGVSQALWLTKSVLIDEGQMPQHVQQLSENLEIPDMEERVHQSIRNCRIYDTTEKMINKTRISYNQTNDLIKLCGLLGSPDMHQRSMMQSHYMATTWKRGEDDILVRGKSGMLLSSKNPLPVLATQDEIQSTKSESLPSFYPLAPTIDLQQYRVVKPDYHFTGFHEPRIFPHAHTLFMWSHEKRPELVLCTAVLFAFANTFCRAKLQHGIKSTIDLPEPVVTQAIVTDGVEFSFIHVQLNTLNMEADEGIKNMVWIDRENRLYRDEYPQALRIFKRKGNRKTRREVIRKNKRKDPEVGCQDLDVNVFRKFLACLANGSVEQR